jgi:hypothetical protein
VMVCVSSYNQGAIALRSGRLAEREVGPDCS